MINKLHTRLYQYLVSALSITLLSTSSLHAAENGEYAFTLTKGTKQSPILPDCSPKGSYSPLTPAEATTTAGLAGFDHLIATFPIRTENPQKAIVARSKKDGTYDTLILDKDLDGSFQNESPVISDTLSKSKTGKFILSFETHLMGPHVDMENLPKDGDLKATVRLIWTEENTTPEKIQWFGYYTYDGEVTIDGTTYLVLLHDLTNDASISTNDRWIIKTKDAKRADNRSRTIKDYNWANGSAWNIIVTSAKGSSAILKKFNTKLTLKEDTEKRDFWFEDKKQPRADKPFTTLTDHAAATKQAADEKKNLILKFETTWCGPCKVINSYVLPQKRIVEASKDYIWLKLDGDKERDLVAKHKVTSYPTFIILNSEGKELKRFGTVSGETLTKNLTQLAKK